MLAKGRVLGSMLPRLALMQLAPSGGQVLKAAINEQRPPHARAADPGMPSSHATSLSFLASYTAAALALQPHAAPLHRVLSVVILLAAAFLVRMKTLI